VVELHDALRHVERVMVGQRDHARTEPYPRGVLGGGGEDQLGRADGLPARGVVLAAPELVETEPVEVGGELDVPFRRVLVRRTRCPGGT
jgi:hypothetical protein